MAVITSPINVGSGTTRFSWRHFDWFLLAIVVVLSVWGCVTVASATLPHNTGITGSWWQMLQSEGAFSDVSKQGLWIVLGVLALFGLARSNYQWLMHLQFWIYAGNLALLLFVLVAPHSIAPTINGAKSWIRLGPLALQPGEICKFALLISMAAFLARRQDHIRKFRTIAFSLLYLMPPLLLILKQPDFGTMLAVMSIWFGMLFFGGAKMTHLGAILLVGMLLFGSAWKFGILKQHQRERLAVFMDRDPSPEAMQAGGYQIKQSQIAIGAGGITGQGWGHGMQNRSGYVPENTTDFIFTVTAEEFGFVGAGILLLLYLLLLLRCSGVALTTDNYFGALLAGGFTALLAFHCIVNLGMTMRVMPITGVPLPFFSYGGSSYLTFAACMGLLQSVVLRRHRTEF